LVFKSCTDHQSEISANRVSCTNNATVGSLRYQHSAELMMASDGKRSRCKS
jgi:hypothetical protein